MSARKSAIFTGVVLAGATLLLPQIAARAQSPNYLQVYLMRQDQSDCSNSNVPRSDASDADGLVSVSRGNDGNTTVKIAMTVSRNTTYHFYLKCVRQLGDIMTDDEGIGIATFTFPTSAAGPIFAFDMYPEGAPPGNKFQSATVAF